MAFSLTDYALRGYSGLPHTLVEEALQATPSCHQGVQATEDRPALVWSGDAKGRVRFEVFQRRRAREAFVPQAGRGPQARSREKECPRGTRARQHEAGKAEGGRVPVWARGRTPRAAAGHPGPEAVPAGREGGVPERGGERPGAGVRARGRPGSDGVKRPSPAAGARPRWEVGSAAPELPVQTDARRPARPLASCAPRSAGLGATRPLAGPRAGVGPPPPPALLPSRPAPAAVLRSAERPAAERARPGTE